MAPEVVSSSTKNPACVVLFLPDEQVGMAKLALHTRLHLRRKFWGSAAFWGSKSTNGYKWMMLSYPGLRKPPWFFHRDSWGSTGEAIRPCHRTSDISGVIFLRRPSIWSVDGTSIIRGGTWSSGSSPFALQCFTPKKWHGSRARQCTEHDKSAHKLRTRGGHPGTTTLQKVTRRMAPFVCHPWWSLAETCLATECVAHLLHQLLRRCIMRCAMWKFHSVRFFWGVHECHYPLVNQYIAMENHHFEWVNQLHMAHFQ